MSLLATLLNDDVSTAELAVPLSEIWLAIRTDGDSTDADHPFGDGSRENPFAVNTPESFANIMRIYAGENTTIHLGPGLFRTRGAPGNGYAMTFAGTWSPKAGQKIIGAGIFATTLRFVWDLPPVDGDAPGQRHFMITSPDFLNSFEISELTLDCNLQNTDEVPFHPKARHSDAITGSVDPADRTKVTASAAFFASGTDSDAGKTLVLSDPVHGEFVAKITAVNTSQQVTINPSAPVLRAGESWSGEIWIYDGPSFTVTGLAISGDNICVRRVRVINFGTRTYPIVDGIATPFSTTYEGFPIRVGGRITNHSGIPPNGTAEEFTSFNALIEDCMIHQPNTSPAREITCVVLAGGINGAASPDFKLPPSYGEFAGYGERLHLQPFGSVIRHCYFNGEFVNPLRGQPVAITQFSYPGSGTNVEVTVTTKLPHNVVKGDYVEIFGCDVTAFNKRFPVTDLITDSANGLVLGLKFIIDTPPTQPTVNGFAFYSPAQTMPVQEMVVLPGTNTVRVTTAQKHLREEGDYVTVSGSLQGAGGIGGLLARTDNALYVGGVSAAHAYYHSDGNGNVTALVNDKQIIAAKYTYDPYGNTLSLSGPLADANSYRFSSKEVHRNSELYYYGYRFYRPNLQRWLNQDRLQEVDGPNLFRFVGNEPMSNCDALGEAVNDPPAHTLPDRQA